MLACVCMYVLMLSANLIWSRNYDFVTFSVSFVICVCTYNTVEVGPFVWLKFCEFCKRRGICESLIRKSLHGTIIQFKVNTGPLLLFVVQPTIAHFSKG